MLKHYAQTNPELRDPRIGTVRLTDQENFYLDKFHELFGILS